MRLFAVFLSMLILSPAWADDCLKPPASCRISSPWGMRIHPVLKTQKMHRGTDFACPVGTPVHAAMAGKAYGLYDQGGGNVVKIEGGNILTKSMHNQYYSVPTQMGSKQVAQGEVVASSGNTGTWTTGPHVHFEVWDNGVNVNPAKYLCGGDSGGDQSSPEDQHGDGYSVSTGSAEPLAGYTVAPEDPPIEMVDGSLMKAIATYMESRFANPEWYKNFNRMSMPRLLAEMSILRNLLAQVDQREVAANEYILATQAQINQYIALRNQLDAKLNAGGEK